MTLGTDRVPCCVMGCRRTSRRQSADEIDFICGKHWKHVSPGKKRRMRWAGRRWRAIADKDSRAARTLARIWWQTYERARTEAIEAAVGIG